MGSIKSIKHYCWPSMAGAEKDGTLLARIAAFPFIITLLDFSNFYGKVIAQQQEWVGGVAYQ